MRSTFRSVSKYCFILSLLVSGLNSYAQGQDSDGDGIVQVFDSMQELESSGAYKMVAILNAENENYRYGLDPKTIALKDHSDLIIGSDQEELPGVLRTNRDILVHRIQMMAYNLPAGKKSADQCVFVRTHGGIDPGPTEIACRLSRTTNGGFEFTLDFPVGLFIPENTSIGCPIGITSYGKKWSQEELDQTRLKCVISYKNYQPGQAFAQIVRLPYLDTFSKGPNFMPQGAFYAVNSPNHPLHIIGIQTFNAQQYAEKKDANGHVINEVSLSVQACIKLKESTGKESRHCGHRAYESNFADYEPEAFKQVDVKLNSGTVHADCMVESANSDIKQMNGDCAIYLLIARPEGTPRPMSASLLYHNHRFSNRHFLVNHYCEYLIFDAGPYAFSNLRFPSGITGAGQLVLDQFIEKTPLEPWVSIRNDFWVYDFPYQIDKDELIRQNNCRNLMVRDNFIY